MIKDYFVPIKYKRLKFCIDHTEPLVIQSPNPKKHLGELGTLIKEESPAIGVRVDYNDCGTLKKFEFTLTDQHDNIVHGLDFRTCVEVVEEIRDYFNFILDDATPEDK